VSSEKTLKEKVAKMPVALLLDKIKPTKQFNDFVRGKKIALVGPSKHLLNAKNGELIDSFDLVARIKCLEYVPLEKNKNKYPLKLLKNSLEDIGTRTDIIYSSRGLRKRDRRRDRTIERFEEGGIKFYIACAPNHPEKQPDFSTRRIAKLDSWSTLCNETPIMDELERYNKGQKQKNIAPQAGFFALLHLIASDCKEISIFGLTFYFGGGNMFYKIQPSRNKPKKGKHNGESELKLFLDCVEFEKLDGRPERIKIDEVLREIIRRYKKGDTPHDITDDVNRRFKGNESIREEIITDSRLIQTLKGQAKEKDLFFHKLTFSEQEENKLNVIKSHIESDKFNTNQIFKNLIAYEEDVL
jgi:hypothetical protein